jgi:hypothetical protein
VEKQSGIEKEFSQRVEADGGRRRRSKRRWRKRRCN